MTKLLELAVQHLRQLPEDMQDAAAHAVLTQLAEEPEEGDREAAEAGQVDFQKGRFSTLKDWKNEIGLGDR